MNKPIVELFRQKHQAEVVDLILTIQQTEYNIPITKEDQPDLLMIETFYQRGKGNFWVARSEEKVVGTIALLDIGNSQAALRKMFVHKDYRGAGYNTARLLLENALAWAKEVDILEVYLGTTPQFLAAHRFYEKNQFTSIELAELPKAFPLMEVDKKFYKYKVEEHAI
ncbi:MULTISPECIES: GNAT family N-acetyltransferase [Bacillaceae]|uniref:GNAT family N-acetyltransferase n=1 Tax=Bacillaceae TaxID=186817 RepID=UPI001E2C841A|nr:MULTISPECIES: GNAT family N-acetyltransferase [Bacillaceae]MCE4048151.1 GNAT family N-acetyltransferase [Bacillus sp. Au-Bac7]MCM3033409.1 GNAT family N-acetyltransferase [Niallia sp. MER 6]MDL0434330.1 GNAT family N-acetyltransferase [Niallia sp. SS-2023]UPO89077.1 GNAT family N-acetyltransferase [Niallia sp. Man26]